MKSLSVEEEDERLGVVELEDVVELVVTVEEEVDVWELEGVVVEEDVEENKFLLDGVCDVELVDETSFVVEDEVPDEEIPFESEGVDGTEDAEDLLFLRGEA